MKVLFDGEYSVSEICDTVKNDISSMGYDVKVTSCDGRGFAVSAKKDGTPLDFMLGRQQRLLFSLAVTPLENGKTEATLRCKKSFGADKIFCFVTGPFLFLINWVFMFLCFGNENNTAKVAERSVQNYADKLKNSQREKTE